MNILVTTGLGSSIISWGNMGDVAMLQAGLARLTKLWPGATINVLTEWPDNLLQFCPDAIPIQAVGRNLYVGEDLLLGRFKRHVPNRLRQVAIKSRRMAALRIPGTLTWCLKLGLRMRNRSAECEAVAAFSETIAASDLVVLCGAGGFYNGCRDWNMEALDTIEAAVQRSIPVAMFGQHFGPLTDLMVLKRAKRILPAVNVITLRGNRGAQSLLESLGVPTSNIHVTGDEAIELAYDARPPKLGADLGINFRLRTSAETSDNDITMLRPILQQFAKKQQVSLVPAPIAVDSSTSDYLAIKLLLQGFDDHTDGGAHLASPRDVIRQVGRCRVLVTCAYHAAVFAMAQGIPVVALAKSRYFVEKFLGLEERFGLGCEIVYLDRPDAPQNLQSALERAWQMADDLHGPLLQAASHQIQASSVAYNLVKELVTN
jgi:colanic acid/amylovoran biosynthesis protein